MSDTTKKPSADVDHVSDNNHHRSDQTAAAEAGILESALKSPGMDSATAANLRAQLLSAQGQLLSAAGRERQKRQMSSAEIAR